MFTINIYNFFKYTDIYLKYKIISNINRICPVYGCGENKLYSLIEEDYEGNCFTDLSPVHFNTDLFPMCSDDEIDIGNLYSENPSVNMLPIDTHIDGLNNILADNVATNHLIINNESQFFELANGEDGPVINPIAPIIADDTNIQEYGYMADSFSIEILPTTSNTNTQTAILDTPDDIDGMDQNSIPHDIWDGSVYINITEFKNSPILNSKDLQKQMISWNKNTILEVINTKEDGYYTNEKHTIDEWIGRNAENADYDNSIKNEIAPKLDVKVSKNSRSHYIHHITNINHAPRNKHADRLHIDEPGFFSYTPINEQYKGNKQFKIIKGFRPILNIKNDTLKPEFNELVVGNTYIINQCESIHVQNTVNISPQPLYLKIESLQSCGNSRENPFRFKYFISNIPKYLTVVFNASIEKICTKKQIVPQYLSFCYTIVITMETPTEENLDIINLFPSLIFTTQNYFWRIKYFNNIGLWQYQFMNSFVDATRESETLLNTELKDRPKSKLAIKNFLYKVPDILKSSETQDYIFIRMLNKLLEFKNHIKYISCYDTSLRDFRLASIQIYIFRKNFIYSGKIEAPIRELNILEKEILSVYDRIYSDFDRLSVSIIDSYNMFLRDVDADILRYY